MNIEEVKISEVKSNPNNPRLIKDDKFTKLVASIKSFPDMLKLRPIVVNDDMIVLGGNMRLKACKEAGMKKVHIIKASNLTEEQQREFIIKDNVGFGEWDWEMIANEWDTEKVEEWGLDVPNFTETNYSDKNKEIDVEGMADNMQIKLNYTEDDYWRVKNKLLTIAQTPESAIFKLLFGE